MIFIFLHSNKTILPYEGHRIILLSASLPCVPLQWQGSVQSTPQSSSVCVGVGVRQGERKMWLVCVWCIWNWVCVIHSLKRQLHGKFLNERVSLWWLPSGANVPSTSFLLLLLLLYTFLSFSFPTVVCCLFPHVPNGLYSTQTKHLKTLNDSRRKREWKAGRKKKIKQYVRKKTHTHRNH